MTYQNYLNPAPTKTIKGKLFNRVEHGTSKEQAKVLRDDYRKYWGRAVYRGFKAPAYVYVEGAVYHVYVEAL